jgi:hypothetical protein
MKPTTWRTTVTTDNSGDKTIILFVPIATVDTPPSPLLQDNNVHRSLVNTS